MSKLQNNYTTKEQSKQLLELGVPADSADCVAHIVDNSIDLYEDFFLKGDVRISVINERHTYTKATTLNDGDRWLDEPYPCWSVGRLIEILKECIIDKSELEEIFEYLKDCIDTVDTLLQMYKEWKDFIDFSKWEK